MKIGLLVSVIIFTLVFAVCGFAQEQDAKETIEKAMQQIQQIPPEQIGQKVSEGAFDTAIQKGTEEAQAPEDVNLVEIEGTVKEAAEDGSHIIVNDTTIITSIEFLAYYPVKEGDQVVVMAASTDEGIKAISISMVDQNKEEGAEELGQPIGKGAKSDDAISDGAQEEAAVEEGSSQETQSGNSPQDVIE